MRPFDCSQCDFTHCIRKGLGMNVDECTHIRQVNEYRKSIESELYYIHCCGGCKYNEMETKYGTAFCIPLYRGKAPTNCGLVMKWLETRKTEK